MVTIQKDTLLEPLKWSEPSVRFTNMLQEKHDDETESNRHLQIIEA